MTGKRFAIFKFCILLLIIIGVPLYLFIYCRDTLLNTEWLMQLPVTLRQYKKEAALILTGLQVLQVIICIVPGQPIQFAASYMFGVIPGLLLSLAGALIGAFISFYIAKVLGRDALHVIFGEERVTDYHAKLNSGKGLTAVLLIYLIPGVPKDITAYVAGISEMRVRPFLLVSTIGRIPGMLGSLLLGHFYGRGNYTGIAVVCVVMAILFVVFIVFRKRITGVLDRVVTSDEERHGGAE